MQEDSSGELQALLDRVRQGDHEARRKLLERACDRLRRLAAHMLHGSFPDVARRHDLDSIIHETWMRFLPALEKTDLPTVADFFRLAAHKFRQVLLDMAQTERRRAQHEIIGLKGPDSEGDTPSFGNSTYDPARLALWTEFHENVGTLSEQDFTVFDMHYYLDLPQAEIARVLDLHPRKVSYLWVAATEKLGDSLGTAL